MGVTKAHHHFVGEKMFKCWGKTEKRLNFRQFAFYKEEKKQQAKSG